MKALGWLVMAVVMALGTWAEYCRPAPQRLGSGPEAASRVNGPTGAR